MKENGLTESDSCTAEAFNKGFLLAKGRYLKVIHDDDIFSIVTSLFDVAPDVLTEQGKAKNPWPNVDAASGSLLYYYGLKEFNFYTVLFSISRTMGMIAQMVWERALGIPITRPKSVTTDWIKKNS